MTTIRSGSGAACWGAGPASNSKKSKFSGDSEGSLGVTRGLSRGGLGGSWAAICMISGGGVITSGIRFEMRDSWKIDSENSILERLLRSFWSWRQCNPYFFTFSSKWVMNFSLSGNSNCASFNAFCVLEINRSIIFSSAFGNASTRLKKLEELRCRNHFPGCTCELMGSLWFFDNFSLGVRLRIFESSFSTFSWFLSFD